VLFVVLAGLALTVAGLSDGESVLAAARSPVVVVLGGLGGLSALSALWTIGSTQASLRSGLVVVAYAAVGISAAVLVAHEGPWPLAGAITILAVIEGALGLAFAALHALPDAEMIGTRWRPGGTLEYSTALGLLQIAALPALLIAMGRSRRLAAAAAFGVVLAGAVLGSIDSRLDLALAASVLVIALLAPPDGLERRIEPAMATMLAIAAGIGAHFVLNAGSEHRSGGAVRLLLLTGMCLGLAATWLPVRRLARRLPVPSGRVVLSVALVVVALAAVEIAAERGSGAPSNQRGGVTHGRIREWDAALETWLDRWTVGAGAGAYYQASFVHQGPSPALFAHDLPLESAAELGVAGLVAAIALYLAAALEVRRARGTLGLWLLGPYVVAFLLANLVDWTWHLAAMGALWAAAAGGLSACGRRTRGEKYVSS
jgi:hypothetical protein